MTNNILEYKGYHARIDFDIDTMTLRGKIEGIGDLVNFESNSIENVEKEFHDAVNDYLEFCKDVGKKPDQEYEGSFKVMNSPESRRGLALRALYP